MKKTLIGTLFVGLATASLCAADGGAAGGPADLSQSTRPVVPSGLSDQLTPLIDEFPASARPATIDEAAPAATPTSPIAVLRDRAGAGRGISDIEVELPGDAGAEMQALAREAEALWAAGDRDGALSTLSWIEDSVGGIAIGMTPGDPATSGDDRGADVRIGVDGNTTVTALDYVAATGVLYAVVDFESPTGWTAFRSANGGATWTETYFWFASTAMVDVDMTIVDSYVYVAYITSTAPRESRLRRLAAGTGASDETYGFKTVYTVPSPNNAEEVAIASNADYFNNRLYIATLQSNGPVQFHWTVAATAAAFNADSPVVANAAAGLDLSTNPGYATYFTYMSYVDTSDSIHVQRYDNNWDDRVIGTFTGAHVVTSLSAYDDNIVVGYEWNTANGIGIRYSISYDGGVTWSPGGLATPGVGEGSFQMVDMTARGGRGTAVVYTQEAGTFDPVYVQVRRGYAPGAWRPARTVNNVDAFTGTRTTINWLGAAGLPTTSLDYGVIFLASGEVPYFDRFTLRPGDMNCDGEINFADIDAFVLALSGETLYNAAYPDCDALNGDLTCSGNLTFSDIDPFVQCLAGDCDCP